MGAHKEEILLCEAGFLSLFNSKWRVSGDQSFASSRTLTEGFTFFNQSKTLQPVFFNLFSKSRSASKYWTSWYNKEGGNREILGLIAHLLKKKSYLKGDESKEPSCSLLDSTSAGRRWGRQAIPVGGSKVGTFFVSYQKVTT